MLSVCLSVHYDHYYPHPRLVVSYRRDEVSYDSQLIEDQREEFFENFVAIAGGKFTSPIYVHAEDIPARCWLCGNTMYEKCNSVMVLRRTTRFARNTRTVGTIVSPIFHFAVSHFGGECFIFTAYF